MSVEWSHEKILQLIELYKEKTEIWDPNDNYYHSRPRKIEAWREIAECMNCDVDCVKAKMVSLLSSFRRERHKTKRTHSDGKGNRYSYESTWFAYKSLSFLLHKTNMREILKSQNVSEEDDKVNDTEFVAVGLPTSSNDGAEHILIVEDPMNETSKDGSDSKKRCLMKIKKQEAETDSIQSVVEAQTNDECTAFGDYMAAKLRKFNNRVRAIVIHNMNNMIFEAEMGKYDDADYPFR